MGWSMKRFRIQSCELRIQQEEHDIIYVFSLQMQIFRLCWWIDAEVFFAFNSWPHARSPYAPAYFELWICIIFNQNVGLCYAQVDCNFHLYFAKSNSISTFYCFLLGIVIKIKFHEDKLTVVMEVINGLVKWCFFLSSKKEKLTDWLNDLLYLFASLGGGARDSEWMISYGVVPNLVLLVQLILGME